MILVTGVSGVLGTALLAELRQSSEGVVGLRSSDVDLSDPGATLAYFRKHRPRHVIHAAAKVYGLGGNREFPCDVFTQNILISTSVIEAARQSGCEKFVAIGTVAAYPDGLPLPISEQAFWSGPPHASERAYANAKRGMLAHLEAAKMQYGMDYLYAIVTNLFGPHDKFDETHGHVIPSLVSKFHRAARTGEAPAIWGTGRARRDFLFSHDAAAAIILAGQSASGLINIASGTTVPIASVVEALRQVARIPEVHWDSTKPDGQLDRSYDTSLLQALGYKPRYTLEEALRITYEWYAENYPNVRT